MTLFLPPISLYIAKIKMPLMPSNTPPTKEIKEIKELNPRKNKTSGVKQVKTQAVKRSTFMSYINTSFKKIPWKIKAIKVVITPIATVSKETIGGKKCASPVKADSVVWPPEIPRIKTIKKRYKPATNKVDISTIFLSIFFLWPSISSATG